MNSPLLGIDLGFQRTGLAISENGILARPLSVIQAKPPHMHAVVEAIMQRVKEFQVATIVIGLPYTEDANPTGQSLKVEQVITQLERELSTHHLSPEIVRVNEFHSSVDAQQLYPGVEIDAAAAALILQDFIDNA